MNVSSPIGFARTTWKAGVLLALLCLAAAPTLYADEKADMVRVVKSEKRLYLLKENEVFASYPVKFGANPKGHKQEQGDERTPEGLYFLTYKNSNSAFYRSIHISYPNAADQEKARSLGVDPGGDVMIHGQANGWEWAGFLTQLVNWTDGCIALTNGNMDQVWNAIDSGTPIEILP
jgi:murein L,D-transpeptidase YafK